MRLNKNHVILIARQVQAKLNEKQVLTATQKKAITSYLKKRGELNKKNQANEHAYKIARTSYLADLNVLNKQFNAEVPIPYAGNNYNTEAELINAWKQHVTPKMNDIMTQIELKAMFSEDKSLESFIDSMVKELSK